MARPARSSSTSGSSPLARGLLPRASLPHPRPGIIPARAGFTSTTAPPPGRTSDHPRSRGVYRSPLTIRCDRLGSSPLARGLQPHRLCGDGLLRIIPARAGFTHPGTKPSMDFIGSSPLARGLPVLHGGGADGDGIIPARAGFTTGPRRPAPRAADHPRSRGVYRPRSRPPARSCGSSPLARGLRRVAPGLLHGRGIIPARAGFTHPR